MTVIRTDSKVFGHSKEVVIMAIQTILGEKQEKYSYTNTTGIESANINTSIKPSIWPLMMKTQFNIQISESDGWCTVKASTCSQVFVMADAFNMYDKYITDFMGFIEAKLQDSN